jgi:FAD synthetase
MKKQKWRTKTKKKVRVLAQGTFDILHPGHLFYLSRAKKWGDELVVIVARDQTARRIKHHAPILDEKTRLKMVSALKMVDRAVLGGKGNILTKAVALKPAIIALGHDQQPSLRELKARLSARGWNGKLVRIPGYVIKKFKSRIVKKKVVRVYQKTST